MGKKAPRRNAFFCYMLEFKRREEAKGVRFPNGLADVSKLAGDQWKLCSQQVKDYYKKQADDYNKSEERAQGLPSHYGNKKKKKPEPSPPNRALSKKEAKQKQEKQFIKNLVEENMTIHDLLDYTFYLIHVNVFCKTDDNEFVPAEIAISRFSLRKGVTDVFHRILSPGVTPLGYSYAIKEHSEKTHRIPLDFVKATKGYLGLYKGITDFLQPEGNSGQMPVLYTMFDEPFYNCSMSAVKYSLKHIWETSNIEDEDDEDGNDEAYEKVFKVMSLPILFFHLKNKCTSVLDEQAVAFENTSEANSELLLKDKYEFHEDMACSFHVSIDNVRYCSQSYVVRWAQVIREQCLQNLESDDEEEEEEQQQMEVTEQVDKVKLERDLKEEKTEAGDRVKSEREIKKEKDLDLSQRREIEDDGHQRNRDDRQIKRERDYGEVKRERDDRHRSYEDSHVKKERDHGFSDVRIKKERDRENGDERIKKERFLNYDDAPIKKEQDRGYDDVRIKNEREDRYRSSEIDSHSRVKPEKVDSDYDHILKEEHLDIPLDMKKESCDDRNSYPRDSKKYLTSRDSSSGKEAARSDPHSEVKLERTNLKTEPSEIKTIDVNYDSLLKTEHLDIPLDIKPERIDGEDSHLSLSNKSLNTKSEPSLTAEPNFLKTQIKKERNLDFPLPITIKLEFPTPCEAPSHSSQISSASYHSTTQIKKVKEFTPSDLLTKEIKKERESPPKTETPINNAVTFDISTTSVIKKERHPDFPLPIPIKQEKSEVLKSDPTSSQTSNNETMLMKKEGDRDPEFPLPIPIKKEFPDVKTNSSAPVEDQDHFPHPKKLKLESAESDFGSVLVKEEPQDPYDVKNEEMEIDVEDTVPELQPLMRPEPSEFTEAVEVKKERANESEFVPVIKIEKFDS